MADSIAVKQPDDEDYEVDENGKTPEELAQERDEKLQTFGGGLQQQFDQQVALKDEIEQRWLDDLRHYNGRYDRETEEKIGKSSEKAKSSRIVVNLTRAKTNLGESKLADLVLPTDDRNWGIKPTPVPEIISSLEDDSDLELADGTTAIDPETQQPHKAKDYAASVMAKAKTRAEAMEKEIDDQLTEARYNEKCREIIHDCCTLGIGIMKGPMVERRNLRAWIEGENGEWFLDYKSDYKPTAERVDPWNFFPDMSATRVEDWEFTYERHLKTRKQMRKLADQPGYMKEQVAKVVQMAPNARQGKLSYLNDMREMNGISQIQQDNRYELLEYRGPIKKEDLISCGCKGVDMDDPLEEYEGVVYLCNGIVIKVGLNHLDSDDLPYSVLNWESDEVSVFGFGIPYRMRNPQRVINASWRMVLDNAGLSTGPQILINKELVEPADNEWKLTPRKIWWMKSKDPKFRADYAMQTFNIESAQSELINIFEMAHRLADEETSLPQLNNGGISGDMQQPAVMKTLGGTALWMSSNNIMMRRAVKNFDDNITVPMITRFYDWNMQFNKKAEIKGDYSIDARGTSVLLVKELQSRNIVEFINTALALPGGAQEINTRGVLEEHAKSLQLSQDEVLLEKSVVDENKKNQPMDAETMKLQMQQQIAQDEIQSKQAMAAMEAKIKMTELEAQRQIALINREVELTRLASQENVDLTKLRNEAGIKQVETQWDMRKFYEELKVKQQMGKDSNIGLE